MTALRTIGLLFLVIPLTTALSSLADTVRAEPITIRFSHVVGENTPKGIGARLFKERAEERLAGKVVVEIYPNSQRFDDDQVITALLFGDIELAAPSLAKFRRASKRLQVFDLPFLFADTGAVRRFQASPQGQALLTAMLDKGIKGLAYWDNGMRVISANKPLRAPSDVRGLTFRIEPSAVIEAQYDALGAVVLRLPFRRVFDALSLGLVDGQENAWSNIASQRFYEFQQHFTESNHSYLGYMVISSVRFWEGLPPDVRSTLEEILTDISAEVNQLALEKAREGRATVEAAGAEVLVLTPEQRTAWRDLLQPVWSEFEAQIGADIIAAAVAANQPEQSRLPAGSEWVFKNAAASGLRRTVVITPAP